MTKPRLILIWSKEDILSSYIKFYLGNHEDWKVVSVSNREELVALLPTVEYAQADTVIIHHECQGDPTDMPLQLLQFFPVGKVITVNLENNAIDVYTRQNLVVQQANDLISVIEKE